MTKRKNKIGIIGTGTMGEIFIKRLILKKVFERNNILIYDLKEDRASAMVNSYNTRKTKDLNELIAQSECVVIAVKPQDFLGLSRELKKVILKDNLILSIMAGKKIETIQKMLGIKQVVRAMPNLPAKLGYGITLWKSANGIPKLRLDLTKKILQSLGKEQRVKEESFLDLATAISGSGPAYVFYFQEIWIKAAEELGLPKEIAKSLVLKTIDGAVNLQKELNMDPKVLREKVSSKGGTTSAAIDVLKKEEMEKIFNKALTAALRRSRELNQSK